MTSNPNQTHLNKLIKVFKNVLYWKATDRWFSLGLELPRTPIWSLKTHFQKVL